VFRVQALPAPSDRQKTQMFLQRYMERFPSGGEIVIFDRSWYNRAGVECVMGFCTKEQHQTFLYAAIAGMFVYALFGTSRQLAVIATSSSAAMLAALVAPIAVDDSTRYVVLTFGAAIAAGAIFLLGGTLKLGVVSEFISKPVLKGFVFGLALPIMAWHLITSLNEASQALRSTLRAWQTGSAISSTAADLQTA
jgi:MFS superfamily sulfate permease-like transporter